jgi:acetolactate synthase small subunit
MQGVLTLYADKKMNSIDTLETFGNDDAIDAILAIVQSASDKEVGKHGNVAIQRIKKSMK